MLFGVLCIRGEEREGEDEYTHAFINTHIVIENTVHSTRWVIVASLYLRGETYLFLQRCGRVTRVEGRIYRVVQRYVVR